MSRGRQSLPKIVRPYQSTQHAETFFDVLVPPGVAPSDAHIYLEAHLGVDIAGKVEDNL